MDYDVVIVGAVNPDLFRNFPPLFVWLDFQLLSVQGPAGLSAAIRLKQLSYEKGEEINVCVVEKGAEVDHFHFSPFDFKCQTLILPLTFPSRFANRLERTFYLAIVLSHEP